MSKVKKIRQSQIVKDNLKLINKSVSNYNKRVKEAFKKGAISDKSFEALYYDKRRVQTMKWAIKSEKHLKSFISMLNKAKAETLRQPKRKLKQYEPYEGASLYELRLLKSKGKNAKIINEMYEDYDPIAKLTSKKKSDYINVFKLLTTADILQKGREANYYDNYLSAFENVFGEEMDEEHTKMLKELGVKGLNELYKNNPSSSVYEAYEESGEELENRKELILNNIEYMWKLKKKKI